MRFMPNIKRHKTHKTSDICVLGAGSWGTALAIAIARTGQAVRLWGRDPSQMEIMARTRCNQRYLPDIQISPSIQIETDLKKALENVENVLMVVPSHSFEEVLLAAKPYLISSSRIAIATKGLQPKTNRFLHEVTLDHFSKKTNVAVLSGPSFAREVASGLPTAITIASSSTRLAEDWVTYLHSHTFRVYPTKDLIGVQLCGAVKNILAIATGINDGLQLGANARAALVTRGLAEMARLGTNMGAKQQTFMGLAGLGDLVLTCTDDQSRNRRLGLALGAGSKISDALKKIGQVVEGIYNVSQVAELAREYKIEMPISEQVRAVLCENKPAKQALHDLLAREPKHSEL